MEAGLIEVGPKIQQLMLGQWNSSIFMDPAQKKNWLKIMKSWKYVEKEVSDYRTVILRIRKSTQNEIQISAKIQIFYLTQ